MVGNDGNRFGGADHPRAEFAEVFDDGTLLPANSVIISTANAAIKVLQFVSILQPSLYHL